MYHIRMDHIRYLALTLPGNQQIQPPSKIPKGGLTTVQKAIGNGITIMIIIAVILSLIYLVWGGVQWTQSAGDKGKIQAARQKITYALIGLVVAFSAFFIVSIFGSLFYVKLTGN